MRHWWSHSQGLPTTSWHPPHLFSRYRARVGHSDNVVSAAVSADSSTLVTASDDCTARLWNLSSGRLLGVLTHVAPLTGVTLSEDGHLALVACSDHTASLWDIASVERICTLEGHEDNITGVSFDGSGFHVATCSRDSTVRYWSTITGAAPVPCACSLCCLQGVLWSPVAGLHQ